MPVQKQTRKGKRPRFKDYNRYVDLGAKYSKEVATALHGAIIIAKLSIMPVIHGLFGTKLGKPHTVPCIVTRKGGSIWIRLISSPCGMGIIYVPAPKKLFQMARINNCRTLAKDSTGI